MNINRKNLIYQQNEYPDYIFEHAYVTKCLGIPIPLNESYPYSADLEAKIISEHLLLEGFFDGLKKLKDDALMFGKALKDIFKNPEKIGSFVSSINKMVLKKMIKPIKSFFTMIKEKLSDIGGDTFPTFIKMADGILKLIDKVLDKIQSLDGWKKAIGVMGLALGLKFVWDKVGDLIEEGKEKLEELVPMLDIVDLSGLNEGEESSDKMEKVKKALKSFAEWFKDKIVGQVVDFIKEKLKGIAEKVLGAAMGGVKTAWDTLTKLYGGAKFVMGTLSPAKERFTHVLEGYIPDDSLLREYIRTILRSQDYERIHS